MKMSKTVDTFESAVRRILLQEWDPIGIKDVREAQDEYDTYVPVICGMLLAGQSLNSLYDYLRWLELEQMGLDGSETVTKQVAVKLKSLLD